MLSIEEVRERLISDKTLILNPDANWNNQNQQTMEDYLYNYMAKNLYMLECPANSEYNMETHREEKTISYIKLIPLDYENQKPDKVESEGKITVYKTNNPKVFWGN
jgi:hypothetical protein